MEKSKLMDNFTDKLYILTERDEDYIKALHNHTPDGLELTQTRSEANIVLASPPLIKESLDDFPQLEWLQSAYAGIDALTSQELRRDYQLTNVRGIFGQQIAEYVLGYSISHYRHFALYSEQQKKQSWTAHQYQSLNEKTMVVLGCGSIGSFLALKASQMGMTTIGINSTGIPKKDSPFDQVYHIQELQSAFEQADIVVNTLPHTEQTKHILNDKTLSYCNNALLFNVGRGSAIEESGLINALESQSIAHAFLDVFDLEPLKANHVYWNHDRITITPHIAASSFPHQVIDQFVENYSRWRDGFSLQNVIDLDKGY